MSLNDYFAANGAVYLRPMGLPDCFSMPGLPHGLKPPSLPLQPQQKPRSMAAVSPLHQGLPPPPPNMGGSYEGGYGPPGQPANRTSSFAAALRKLAKQAVDPVAGDKDPSQISPVSSPSLGGQGGPQKRTAPANSAPPPPMFLTSHQGAYGGSSPPPVVTIAPSRPVATHTSDSRKVVDLSSVPPNNNPNPISNGHMQEPLKMDSSKGLPRHSSEKWEESTLSTKGLSVSSASSQVRPHATIAPLPRPDDSVTSSRGFQPYRGAGAEESRNTLPHHPLSMFEHHHPSYPYAPAAFLPPPPHHMAHPAYRFDDPLYLERYSLLRPPMLQYGQPSMMGPPAFYPNSRYAADLIAQSLSISNNSMLNHERLKAEEQERRIREKEQELKEQERQRDREHRDREKERRHSKDAEHYEHRKNNSSTSYSSSAKRTESPNVRTTPVIHGGTPNHVSAVVSSSSSSTPLNLVLQSGEPQRKETTELWMPWQQPANSHAKDANQDMGNKHPAFRAQDGHRHHQTRENHTNDKPPNLRFSPSASMDKKQPVPTPTDPLPPTTIDKKQHPDLNSLYRTSDTTNPRTHQDILPRTDHRNQDTTTTNNNRTSYETPKDTTPHEWRHEKLQKACTNIHRKSHESKRANSQKDGIYQNHRNKAVNGAVLKPTTLYQNEGMHARLLESEKCRMEMNGHIIKSPGGLVVPSPYKPSGHYPPQQKDHCQKSFSDYFGGASSVLLKSSVELPPVVSKLDIELRRLRKGEKVCEEKEEKRMRNLLVIAKMPQLKFDSNPHKLNFLRLFGLTTHLKKKKVEFDMFLKRRKRLRQDSSLPPPTLPKDEGDEEEDEDLFSPEKRALVEVDRLSERLRTEDAAPEKRDFLAMFGLKPFTLELREEKDRLRRKVSEEKYRRHYRMLATVNRKSSPKRLFTPKSEAAQRLDHLKKLSEMNAVPNGLISKRMDEDEETSEVKPSSGKTVAPKLEQVPYHHPSSSESTPAHKSSSTKYSFKRGHSLKREFRFATPHSNGKSIRLTNGAASSSACRSVGTQADTAADKCAAELKSSLSLSATIETLMEVIYRSQTEQSGEKSVLSERCQQLRQTQEDLKKQADALSRQMSDLLRSKRELDEERQGHQKSIDHLKKCLQLGR